MNTITANPIECFRRESPSLVRVDVVYGRGASSIWLYEVLQATLLFLGVDNEKFRKEQVLDLASTIANQYKTLKMAEIILFLSRFKAGKYGRFYGGDSYALVITESLNKFMQEREDFYAEVERQKQQQKMQDMGKDTITYEEYKKIKEKEGGQVSDILEKMFGNNEQQP